MDELLKYEAEHAIKDLDRLIERYLPSWEGGAAVKAREVILKLLKEREALINARR